MSTRKSVFEETETLLESSLQELIKLIKDDKDRELFNRDLDDKFLIKFLRVTKFDAKQSLNRIKCWYSLRRSHPNMFVLPSTVQDIFDDGVFDIHKRRGPNGELIVILRPGKWEPSKFDLNHFLSSLVGHFELFAEDENIQKNGVLEVVDVRGIALRHFWAHTPAHLTLSNELNERGVPIRFKRINVMFASRFIDIVWNIMKWMMSEDMRNRILFHRSDLNSLHQEVPIDLLPEDLGGTAKPEDFYKWTPDELKELDDRLRTYWDKYPIEPVEVKK